MPRLTDRALDNPRFRHLREEVCAGLRGEVVEIGFGSGLNVPFYPDAVTRVIAIEPSDLAWHLAADRIAARSVPVVRGGLDGERLDLPDASVDGAISVLTLCTIPDPATALAELHRVLRVGAALHFLEHGLSPDPGIATWQRRLNPIQRRVAAGCHLTRLPRELITASGLAIDSERSWYLPGPGVGRPWGWLTIGVARRI